jgi:hypothetical protein
MDSIPRPKCEVICSNQNLIQSESEWLEDEENDTDRCEKILQF